MDVPLLIKQRLSELDLDQKELAAAAQVTESYISQLLARKKAPPAPERTAIYEKIGEFLKLPPGELPRLADVQRRHELKRKVAEPPSPLFPECRGLLLRKCEPDGWTDMRTIFEKEPFGELERLVTYKLVAVAQEVARNEWRSEDGLRLLAQLSGRSGKRVRAALLEFLDADIFHVSLESCVSFLDPAIDSWNIDLKTFAMNVVLNRRLASGGTKQFEFMEKTNERPAAIEPGFAQFLQDKSLSGDATGEEIEFLSMLKFRSRRPAAIYYYRELQNLRDPLHFPASVQPTEGA